MDKIAQQYKTPFYLFDADVLKKRVNTLHTRLHYPLVYAIKANPFIGKELINEVARYEICSLGELQICLDQKIPYEQMVISGVNKDESFLEAFASLPVKRVTIESVSQYESLKHLALKYHRTFSCLLRLSSGNQFGLSEKDMRMLFDKQDENMTIKGIEYFSGTQKHSIKKIHKEIQMLYTLIQSLPRRIEELEYGPGLLVSYFNDFDEDTYLKAIKEELSIFDIPVYLESGRSIAASCGTYVSRIMDLKTIGENNYAIVDGGIHQIVYYGTMLGMHIPRLEHFPKKTGNEKTYTICGSLCTTNDILIRNITLHDLAIGDLLIFKDAGAYAMCEGISLFLTRELPAVLIKNKDKIKIVRDHTPTVKLNGGL